MPDTQEHERPIPRHPNTIAKGQNPGEERPVPGSLEYEAYFEDLWQGKISYEQFMQALNRPKRAD